MLRIAEHFHDSDLGRQRQGNEDNYYVRAPLFVVADGMGGAQAGEVASEMAVRSFEGGLPDGDPRERLVETIEAANARIHERSRADSQRAGMGTTLTAAYVAEDAVVVAHVGDSRCYLLRGGDLVRLTRDHSLVGELVARGKLTEEQAEQHPQRSVITRALGPEADVQVDVDIFPAKAGDLFLLCSDGLTSMVHEPKLRPLFDDSDSLETLGKRLIDAANAAGGRDNITVILFRLEEVDGTGSDAPAAATAVSREDDTRSTRPSRAMRCPRRARACRAPPASATTTCCAPRRSRTRSRTTTAAAAPWRCRRSAPAARPRRRRSRRPRSLMRRPRRAAPPRSRETPAPSLAASAAGASQSASSSPSSSPS